MTPLSKKWKSGNVRVTHNLPGNEVLNISVTIRFTNELVDCNMVYQMIEPDMGDLQQTAHHFSLENEPAAPLSKMLQPHEMTWFRTRERTDAEKYRPTMCLSQGPRDRASFGDLSDEAILPFDGFTAVFVVPKVDESSTLVEFNLEEGACELQVLCKNKICTFSLSLSHNPLYELPIHEIPAGGVHEFMERGRQFTSNVFILVAHPVRRSGDVWKQFLSVYRNMHRVTDGDAEIDSELLSRRCGGNSTSTAMEKEGSMIKLLNWPEYELSGPSVVRAEAAYKQLIKECNESYTGIPYNASAQPYLSEIYPNNAVRMHYALSGLPCSGPCRSGYDKSYSAHMMCYTTRKREPCTKEFFTIISREIYDMTRDSNSPLYSAFAIQYCKSEFLRINELGASQIASQEARSCNISGNIRSLSRVIKCEQDRPLEELKDKFDLNQCMLVKKDENHRHRLALDAVKLRLKPVIRSCRPHPDVAPLYQSYKRENFRVYMRTHNDRKCPIGYRKEKSVDNFTCTRCPADSYADINTELNTCQGCPMTRPSTFFADSASSTQCSNEQLNQIRGMFFRYDTANYTDEEWESGFDFTTPQWWNFPYNKFESLEHLKPNESYLENQRQAISAFLAMTQLTFSDGEVFLLLVISTSLAVYGGVISMLILAATSIPRPCPAIGFYGPDPSFKERIGLAIYCQLAKIGLMIFSIWKRIIARVTYETKRARQSMVSQRLSRVTSTAGKRMSSLLRRQWDKNRLPPLTDRQKALIRLVSETTINRIVEFAERELAERRQRRELIREEQHRRRQEVGEIEAEAADIEAMAAVAQREAKEAEQYVADAKDGKSRLLALQAAEEAKQRAESLTSRASRMRMSASQRLTEILEFDLEEELIPIHKRRLSIEDEHAIQNAAPELRAFLRLPRHHTAAYFLLHPDIHQDELLRKTAFPAPERDWKRT